MATYPELRGKTAIVTGGNTGIGESISRRFAEQGTNMVVVGSRHPEKSEGLVRELEQQGGKALAIAADLTKGAEADRMVRETIDRFGQVDILVNCAGGFPSPKRAMDLEEEDWDWVLALNLKSAFLCSKAVLPGMIERRWGRIVNIASEAGRMPVAITAAHYAASKAGMLGLTRHLAREVAQYGITVNATAPSTTYSDRVRGHLTPEREANFLAITPIGRIAECDEQAGAVLFLASDDADYITGATLDVAGGKVMM